FVKKVTKSHSEWAIGKNFNFFHQKSEKIQISSFLVPKVKKSNFNFFLQKIEKKSILSGHLEKISTFFIQK
ncbi:hypothetical protein NDU88_000409, partial [Pleurodeles waltl]